MVGGRKAASMRRAGRLGDGYISHMCAAQTYRANLDLIAKRAREAGREAVDFQTLAFLFSFLDDSYDAALDRAAQILGTIYNRPFRDAAKKYCLLGRPEDCLEQLREFARAGARHFVFSPLSNPDDFVSIAEKQILPELRGLAL